MSLTVSNLNKFYDGQPVLDDINLSVSNTEFVSLIGPSGCGKSTLFSVIAGLEHADSGTVDLNGGRSAYMPQKDVLFPWRTILDNTTLGLQIQGMSRRDARKKAQKLFGTFGLAGYEKSLPKQLSGGMRQRAALLRTVVQSPDLLLLDEPFGALDALTRIDMQDWLASVWFRAQWTAMMITHDVREAVYLSDRILVLSPRPAHISGEILVPLERPRQLGVVTTQEFVQLEESVLALLRQHLS